MRYWRVTIKPAYQIWDICRDNGIVAIGYPNRPGDSNVDRFKNAISIGDKVVIYLTKFMIGAIGIIKSNYNIDQAIFREHFWRTRKIKWEHNFFSGEYCKGAFSEDVQKLLSRRNTVQELTEDQFQEIVDYFLSF